MNAKRIALGITTTIALGAAGAGIAGAASSNGSAPAGGPPGAAAITTYLGISASDLQTALQSGKTLAQIATANGKTVAGLETAMIADAKTHLDADVTAGRLTAAQEQTIDRKSVG